MKTPLSISFGEAIRAQRKVLGLTQEEAAWRSEIDVTLLSRIERGIGNPTITTMCRIADALKTTVSALLS